MDKDIIQFDDFAKVDLRIALIVSAERVEGSEKLLKLKVLLEEGERQILAGVGKKYGPEEMVGKQIVVVANLAPRMMMGFESQGMLLAASGEEGPVLLQPEVLVKPGASVG